jgi:general secretion pathway protein I
MVPTCPSSPRRRGSIITAFSMKAAGSAIMDPRLRGDDEANAMETTDGGFTLIEIMVALAVFSLAVLALLRLETATIRGAAVLDDSLLAGLVARNVANDAVSDAQPPVAGRTTGSEVNGGRSWAWVRQVRPTGNASIVRIDVVVANRAGQIVGRTTAIRPADTPL